jgi:hypothetical protein
MKTLSILIAIMFIALNFGFKNKTTEINKTLLCKQWEIDAKDDVSSKIIITFNANNTYTHEYVSKGVVRKENVLLTGKWLIGQDKKIYITFNETTSFKDIFEIVSIKENELILNTTLGIKKFEKLK